MSISPSSTLVFLALPFGWVIAGVINRLADHFIGRRVCGHCGWAFSPGWPAILVYLRRRGRCPDCGAPLALRPVLVELATPLLFLFATKSYGINAHAIAVAGYLAVLLLVSVIDLATRRIPNAIILPASGVALLLAILGVEPGFQRSLRGGLVGLGVFLIAYALGGLFLRIMKKRPSATGPALGAGDVKLALFIGLTTGYPGVIIALFIGAMVGAAAALIVILWRLVQRRYQPLIAMAYGPYLAAGAAIALLWSTQLIR